jgi:hypothetical protein
MRPIMGISLWGSVAALGRRVGARFAKGQFSTRQDRPFGRPLATALGRRVLAGTDRVACKCLSVDRFGS